CSSALQAIPRRAREFGLDAQLAPEQPPLSQGCSQFGSRFGSESARRSTPTWAWLTLQADEQNAGFGTDREVSPRLRHSRWRPRSTSARRRTLLQYSSQEIGGTKHFGVWRLSRLRKR